jgi:hypothetical protein
VERANQLLCLGARQRRFPIACRHRRTVGPIPDVLGPECGLVTLSRCG